MFFCITIAGVALYPSCIGFFDLSWGKQSKIFHQAYVFLKISISLISMLQQLFQGTTIKVCCFLVIENFLSDWLVSHNLIFFVEQNFVARS